MDDFPKNIKNFKPKFKSNLNKNMKDKKEETKMYTKTINIEAMQCNHCKMSVEKALNSIEGITKVDVSLENKNAKIEANNQIDDNKIREVIEEAGFEVKEIM